jgi:hypothetical protein
VLKSCSSTTLHSGVWRASRRGERCLRVGDGGHGSDDEYGGGGVVVMDVMMMSVVIGDVWWC